MSFSESIRAQRDIDDICAGCSGAGSECGVCERWQQETFEPEECPVCGCVVAHGNMDAHEKQCAEANRIE